MKKLDLLLLRCSFEYLTKHIAFMSIYVSGTKENEDLIRNKYAEFLNNINSLYTSLDEEISELDFRDFLLYFKIYSEEFIEIADSIFYNTLKKIPSYDKEIISIKNTLGKMKTEIETQINSMGEVLTDHHKSIENLYTNQSMLIGLSNIEFIPSNEEHKDENNVEDDIVEVAPIED